jgi:serine/threonine protein kinase
VFDTQQLLQQRYQLQQQLGRTAAGHLTWLAIDRHSQERVTIKLLAFNPQMQWEELKLFEREAQILQTLDHPRIPKYRDYFDLDKNIGGGVPWFALVQDYLPGNSLQELIEGGRRFTEKQIRDIATQVLEILIYLHQLSPPVLHRDIKPSNLILGEDNLIYLIDFGAVQAQAAVTGVTFTVVGTSGYAPLEQFWGRAVPSSDLYALGATLIHLLTGIAPADLPQKDSRIQFRDRVSLSQDLIGWIEQITEIAIEKRFRTATEALDALKSRLNKPLTSDRVYKNKKFDRPHLSRIELNKSLEKLEIKIPAGGLDRFCLEILNIDLGSGILNSVFFLFFISFLLAVSPLMAWLVIWLLLGKFFSKLFLSLFERKEIYFHRHQFELVTKIFGITFHKQKANNDLILGIFLRDRGKIHQVTIRSFQSNVYTLGGALNEYEAAWLAQEIQDWLDRR